MKMGNVLLVAGIVGALPMATWAAERTVATVDFSVSDGPKIRPELHSSGFGPQICWCPKEDLDAIRAMGFKASRTHDWALINPNQRVCDWHMIFPLPNEDAKDPSKYVFAPTDYLLKRTREELGHEIFFRLGTSIEPSGDKVHFNTLIPEDFDKVAEVFAATVRHYNRGWANGYNWGIRYWEIWNEPDGLNTMWCLPDGDRTGDPAEDARRDKLRRDKFAALFVTCLKRLKDEFGDSIKVGGPAMCWMKREYFAALFEACRQAGVKPDFISWHNYTDTPELVMHAIDEGRALCDSYGFTDCELIINEWHYFGPYGWGELRSADPAVRARVWEGPASHNGIDSACFNLTLLSKFQTSKLDQAYYYGCRNVGSWGFKDEANRKYKVFYAMKQFGRFVRTDEVDVICPSTCDDPAVTVFAVRQSKPKAGRGARRALVVDYRGTSEEIELSVKGAEPWEKPWLNLLDAEHDFDQVPARMLDGKILLKKRHPGSAAFFVAF